LPSNRSCHLSTVWNPGIADTVEYNIQSKTERKWEKKEERERERGSEGSKVELEVIKE